MSAARLRIAHISGTFPPYRSGTGSVVWHETHQLALRGHDVHVFTPASMAATSSPSGVRVHEVRPWVRIGNASLVPAILPLLRGFDVLHLHYPFFSAECVWAASRLYRTPYVASYVHDVELEGLAGVLPRVYGAVIGHRVLQRADRLLFATLDYARSSTVHGLARGRNVRRHAYGVDESAFGPAQRDHSLRQEWGIKADELVLIFVASLDRAHYFKGLPVLFDALRLLPRSDVRLVVVGEGDMRAGYTVEAKRRGLSDRVLFTGGVSDEMLPSCYAAADVLVLASVSRSEAYGLVLLEALACGTPVVASSLPGVRQIVKETGGGLLTTPGDAADLAQKIQHLLNDPDLRAELGARGRKSIEANFRWSALGQQLEDIYAELLDDARGLKWGNPVGRGRSPRRLC